MQRMSKWMGTATLAVVLAGFGTNCGRDAVDADVTARNLSSGEIQTFSSEGEVPEGWAICSDPTCSTPPAAPCEQLGQKVCTLNPACRLREFNCRGTGWVDSNGNSGGGTTQCETECVPKLPLQCEELTDEKECQARPDCELAPSACPAMACAPGQPDCDVPCHASCHKKMPAACDGLDETACKGRTDCEWAMGVCPMCAREDGTPCDCYPSACRAVPLGCPTLSPLPPDFCKNGLIEPQGYDAHGCPTGYDCLMPGATGGQPPQGN